MSENKIIPAGKYEGYIWMSDGNSPRIIDGDFEGRELKNGENPFVAEAQLYNLEEKKSYSIKFVDGEYMVYSYEITSGEIQSKEDIQEYESNRMGKTLCFLQRWVAVKDPLCEGMEVLRPKEAVFIGFKH